MIFIVIGLVGCSSPKPVAPPVVTPPAVPAPAPVAPGPVQPGPATRTFDESILHGKEFLLQVKGPAVPEVRDPVVGALNRDPEVQLVVEALFRAAALGELDPDTLVPRWSTYLQTWAKKYKAEGLEKGTIRVGTVQTKGPGGVFVPVRVFTTTKDLAGWVDLDPEEDRYLVSDVQVVERSPRQGPIDPESPDQSISSPTRR